MLPLPAHGLHVLLEAGDGQGTGRLQHRAGIGKDVLDGGTDGVGVDRHHAIHVLLAEAEGFPAHLADGDTVGKNSHVFEAHALPGREGATHGIGIHRFHPDDLHLGPEGFHVGRNTADQAAATHRHVDRSGGILQLPQDFHADGALPGNHLGVVKGVNEAETVLLHQLLGSAAGIVEGITVQHHLGPQLPHTGHLHRRCGLRHDDHGPAAEALGSEGNTLGMVARTGGNHTQVELSGAELADAVVGTTELEGEDRTAGLHASATRGYRGAG